MKLNKILFAAALASVIGGSMTSCSESFLDEDLKTQYSTDRFKTQEGLDELVTGAYQKLKFKFNYIWAIECHIQSPNQKIPDRKTKCVIKTHINIKQNVIFGAKLKPV